MMNKEVKNIYGGVLDVFKSDIEEEIRKRKLSFLVD